MSLAQHKKVKSAMTAAIIISTFVLAYQNCSQVSDEKKLASGSDSTTQVPFAYDVDIDTFAYMSCSERPELDKNTYFTVKMASLRLGSGVFLSHDFREYVSRRKLTKAQVQTLLAENQFSKDAKVQVSLRSTTSLRGNPIGVGPFNGRVSTVWTSLSNGALATNLSMTDNTSKLNHYNGAPLAGAFLISGGSDASIQEALTKTGMAVVGFQGGYFSDVAQRDYRIISPFDVSGQTANAVFGRGLDPVFDSPIHNGSKIVMHGLRTLGAVTENKIDDGSFFVLSSWNCKSQAQYRIVPYDERINAGCNPDANNAGFVGDEAKAYSAVRALLIESLPGDRWRIDQVNRCVVDMYSSSAASQCYDPTKGPIQWGLTASDTCGGNSGKQCPHYVSICWR